MARPDLHQARPDHLQRRGDLPAGARHGVQAVPRSGSRRAVRCGPQGGRRRPRRTARERLHVLRSRAARGGVDRPGARRDAAHRREGRGQGAAPQRRPTGPQGPPGDGVAGTAPRRADPDRVVGQSSGAGRVVRRDDRRGARLPHGSRQHDRHRRDASRVAADRATSCRARTRRWSLGGCW